MKTCQSAFTSEADHLKFFDCLEPQSSNDEGKVPSVVDGSDLSSEFDTAYIAHNLYLEKGVTSTQFDDITREHISSPILDSANDIVINRRRYLFFLIRQMHNNIMAAVQKVVPPYALDPGKIFSVRVSIVFYDTLTLKEMPLKGLLGVTLIRYKLLKITYVLGFVGCLPLRDGESASESEHANATSSSTRPSSSTRHKGKEIAKPVTPQSESVSDEDSDPEQAQRDKEMQKNLALLANEQRLKITTRIYNNDNQSGQFGNQRKMTVAGARETVGSQVVQQNGIQCFNCKGFGHYAKEFRESQKRGIGSNCIVSWQVDSEVLLNESSSIDAHVEQDDSNVTPDSSNICNNDNQGDQNVAEYVDDACCAC
ncbi:hypothetical protein Tco_0164092 [Tanacetum coccineum]